MLRIMLISIAALIALLYLLAPLAVRWTYRVAAHCRPTAAPLDRLSEPVAAIFRKRIPELRELGFELAGCYDCGCLATDTHSYVAYFSDRANDFANVTTLVSPGGVSSYLEFSTKFTIGLVLETNTNRVPPLTPANPETRVFRFPELSEASALLHAHRQILEKYAGGLRPQGEPRGLEIERYARVVENYGPRHNQIGYMRLTDDGQWYQLTWKGAFLMTWRGLWPVSFVRHWMYRHNMNSELHALQAAELGTLQKA